MFCPVMYFDWSLDKKYTKSAISFELPNLFIGIFSKILFFCISFNLSVIGEIIKPGDTMLTLIFREATSRANDLDRGNWINLCYWDGNNTERYAIHEGKKLNLEQFVDLAEKKTTSYEKLQQHTPKLLDHFSDGPPCLQHIITLGFPEGSRNISLFNVGVYFRKKNPDDWQEDLMRFNYEHLPEALPSGEVNALIKSVSRKDYAYTCKQAPICNYCEKSKCIKRDYGVGGFGGGLAIEVDAITKYETENKQSVRWYIEMQGERIEVTTHQLLDQRQ